MTPAEFLPFQTPAHLSDWLAANHASQRELWVQIYKKQTGTASVAWEDCVVTALMWGWIDGQKQPLDAGSYLQRLTPRRAKSTWSKKNCDHAERLIAEGRMQPAGLAHVEVARQDGRWDSAYAGSAEMVIPDDFVAALDGHAKARAFYDTLNRANLFAIYWRLHTAKRPQTREKRMRDILEKLERQERLA